MNRHFVLLAAGPDRIGLRDTIESWVRGMGATFSTNVRIFSDSDNTVFLRIEFVSPTRTRDQLRADFTTVATQWELETWHLQPLTKPRVMVLVSRTDHCLAELLSLHRQRQLAGDIIAVAGNHLDLRHTVEQHEIPFTHIPWPGAQTDPAGNNAAHNQLLQLIKEHDIDVLVLARFMQILKADVVHDLVPTINIHHSTLPSFVGADPYRQAHARGVKEVGATAHYVTGELDQGPIIAQESISIERLGTRPTPQALRTAGRTSEVRALLTALTRHCKGELIVYRGGTVHIEP